MTTGKTTALTIWTFGIEGMSMLFNTLSKLVIAFLPKSKCLLISWLQSPCTMILVLEKWKSITVSTLPHSVSHRVIGLDATIFSSVSQLCLTLQPHGLQHTRLPCPSPTPRVCSNMSPLTLMPFNHLILCCPLLFQSSIFPSISAVSNESILHIRWPKYWSFSFSMSPLIEYSGLISFRIHCLDLLEVQGTLKWLQHYNSEASTLWHSTFLMVQLSHPYMTRGKP